MKANFTAKRKDDDEDFKSTKFDEMEEKILNMLIERHEE